MLNGEHGVPKNDFSPKKYEAGVRIACVDRSQKLFTTESLCFLEEKKKKSFKNVQFESEAFHLSPKDESRALQTPQVQGPQASARCPSRRDCARVEDAQGGALCVSLPVSLP